MKKRIIYNKEDGVIKEFIDIDVELKGLNKDLKFIECECIGNESNISEISSNIKDLSIYDGRILSPMEFINKFTYEEISNIELSTNIYIIAIRAEFFTSSEINLESDKIINGLNKLIELNILTEQRKIEILS